MTKLKRSTSFLHASFITLAPYSLQPEKNDPTLWTLGETIRAFGIFRAHIPAWRGRKKLYDHTPLPVHHQYACIIQNNQCERLNIAVTTSQTNKQVNEGNTAMMGWCLLLSAITSWIMFRVKIKSQGPENGQMIDIDKSLVLLLSIAQKFVRWRGLVTRFSTLRNAAVLICWSTVHRRRSATTPKHISTCQCM